MDFSNEGIHGLNHTKATPLPAPVAVGSTWNRDLVREAGEIAGKEAKALGYTNIYAPILDVVRDPRWGRTLECYGEDPYLISELGIQMVEGIQSQGIASTLKHFAVYSVPKGGRDGQCRTDPHVTPREMHEIHLYPFRKVITQAHPMGVMSSYNDWNGEPVTASSYFLTDLLREEYGFNGYVVSDSDAVEFVYRKHQVAETYEEAVRMVLEAGLNVRTTFNQPSVFIEPVDDFPKPAEMIFPLHRLQLRPGKNSKGYAVHMGLLHQTHILFQHLGAVQPLLRIVIPSMKKVRVVLNHFFHSVSAFLYFV